MKILFICTHNRCRSILGEAIANHINSANNPLIARSAGSAPVGEVHPLSLKFLAEKGISTDGLTSQSWDEHEAFQPDVVITVCDSAAQETCPVWFGNSARVHWGLQDPSKMQGTEEQLRQAFFNTIAILSERLESLTDVNSKNLSQAELENYMNAMAD